MSHTIDFVVYCPWEFTSVIAVVALETIGAFGSPSPLPNPLTLSLSLSLRVKSTRNEVDDEEEGVKWIGNKRIGMKILKDVKNFPRHFLPPLPLPASLSTQPFLSTLPFSSQIPLKASAWKILKNNNKKFNTLSIANT
jgi:hypothetical protein